MDIRTEADFSRDDCEILIITTFTKVDSELLEKLPSLKFIQVASTGYDNVDLESVRKKGIMLSNAPSSNKESVAEHVIGMVLYFLKDFRFLDQELRNGNWPMLTGSREMKGKTFGIIGMGAIGRRLVERLLPFEPGIVYYDPRKLDPDDEASLGVSFLELDDLIAESDIISIHVPLTPETRNMLGKERIEKLKDGAILINTARGEVVDEQALIRAVKEKGVKAGIDVYVTEPPDFSSEIFKLDGILLSPHIAGVTVESQQRFLQETIANVIRYVQGVKPINVVVE
ncbi:MAG: NAD(P)-dependent oxidoreductase [Thermoplasmataceae archaeon]